MSRIESVVNKRQYGTRWHSFILAPISSLYLAFYILHHAINTDKKNPHINH